MAAILLPAGGYRSAPWRNGHGVSREIARGEDPPGGGTMGARWLVSLTTIEADCPFSDYRGYDRILTPLGEGIALAVGGAPPAALVRYRPFAFPGDAPVACTLAAGPAAVLNAMVARAWGSQTVTMLRAAQARFTIAAPLVLLHAPGGARAIIGGAAFTLAAGDSLRIDDLAGAEAVIAVAAADTPLALVAFRPHD
jgi:environmental stress-induced protein Ves